MKKTDVLALLRKNGIDAQEILPLEGSFSSHVYDVDDRYILKINPDHKFENEVTALRFLEKTKIPVPKIVFHHKNHLLIEKIKGNTFKEIDLSEDLYQQLGRLLHKLHTFEQENTFLYDYDKRKLKKVLKLNLPKEIKTFLTQFTLLKKSKYVHGDPSKANILSNGLNISGIIDWEYAQGGNPGRDVALFFLKHDQCYWEAFSSGYGAIPRDVPYYVVHLKAENALWIQANYPDSLEKYINDTIDFYKTFVLNNKSKH